MDFKKDLLLVDLETTGLDVKTHEIIQLAAVLLDKKTLREKQSFCLYVKPKKWKTRNLESMAVNKISREQVASAPDLKLVLKKFNQFANPRSVVLSFYGGPIDMDFLRAAYAKAKMNWRFDYHYFNLWAVFYGILAKKNLLANKRKHAGFTLEDLTNRLKIIVKGSRHDALYDCRVEAEILRKLMK